MARTPIFTSSRVNDTAGGEVYFKCENFQRTGSFKFRGACNAVFSLSDEEAVRGVVTHSSGNHAQAVSLAAAIRGIPAYVVIPENAPRVKIAAVKEYGAEITFCEATLKAREATAGRITRVKGARFIPSYDHPLIISGQGTAALELLQEIPDLDLIIAPVGGGGLISGTAIAAKSLNRKITVIAAEPEMADDAFRSFYSDSLIQPTGVPETIADGLRTSLSELTFNIIRRDTDRVVTIRESSIIRDMKYLYERMKLVVEPSSALPLSALFDRKTEKSWKKAGVILSGGNVDLDLLPWQNSPS